MWSVPLNDCLLRNMYRYHYLVILDLDELIVSRQHEPYSLMLRRVDQRRNLTRPAHQYTFRNAYFLREFEPTDTSEALRSLRMRFRANISGNWFVVKSFVDPWSCFNVLQHFCKKQLAGYSSRLLHVPNDIAIKLYFRECPSRIFNCTKLFQQKTRDDLMLGIKPRLLAAVEPVLRELDESQ